MAISSILAWKIPWKEKPGELHSPKGLQRIQNDNQKPFFVFQLISIEQGFNFFYMTYNCL